MSALWLSIVAPLGAAAADSVPLAHYVDLIHSHISADYKGMFREKGGAMEYPFITPGSQQYADVLWDWDSWLSDVALRQELLEHGTEDDRRSGIATPEQAARMVREHLENDRTFAASFGVRTLSKAEKM